MTDKLIPFWGAIICSNVWAAAGDYTLAVMWLVIAAVVLVSGVANTK
jgi:hypothetical protein